MKIYTIHSGSARELPTRPEDVALAPEHFSWTAFLFGPLWLLAHRLWAWAVVWAAAAALYGFLAYLLAGRVAPSALIAGAFLAEILFGFEAHDLRRRALERSGRPAVDVVAGRGEDAAARRFFRRLAEHPGPPPGGDGKPPPLPGEKGFLSMFPDERAP